MVPSMYLDEVKLLLGGSQELDENHLDFSSVSLDTIPG